MTDPSPVTSTALEVSLRPRIEHVWAVRQLVETHCGPILGDPSLLDRLSVTAHELLENAAKYGADGLSSLQIQVTGSPVTHLRVAVRNPIDHQQVPALRRYFEEMTQAGDPFAFYQARMARAAKIKSGSGLGLARISFEAEMSLSLDVDERHVSLIAATPIPRAEMTT